MKKLVLLFVLMGCVVAYAQSITKKKLGPDCSGGWPTQMAYAKLKNVGIVSPNAVDFSKTKTERLASQSIDGKMWHQVYLVTYFKKSGEKVEVIAIHDASDEECSMTDVDVFVVSQHLQAKK
jgi:hypothetical protein